MQRHCFFFVFFLQIMEHYLLEIFSRVMLVQLLFHFQMKSNFVDGYKNTFANAVRYFCLLLLFHGFLAHAVSFSYTYTVFQSKLVRYASPLHVNRNLLHILLNLRQNKSKQPDGQVFSSEQSRTCSTDFHVLLTQVPWLCFPFVSYYLNCKQEPVVMFVFCFVCFFSYGLIKLLPVVCNYRFPLLDLNQNQS